MKGLIALHPARRTSPVLASPRLGVDSWPSLTRTAVLSVAGDAVRAVEHCDLGPRAARAIWATKPSFPLTKPSIIFLTPDTGLGP